MDNGNRKYTNGEITVYWKPSKCVHATTCFSELIEVFNPSKRPWVNMQGATTDKIIEVVNKCPTDALTYKNNSELNPDEIPSIRNQDSNEHTPETIKEEKEKTTTVQIMKDGPLMVSGSFKLIGPNGNILKSAEIMSFCRCGHSGNMPFCDGSHRKFNFND